MKHINPYYSETENILSGIRDPLKTKPILDELSKEIPDFNNKPIETLTNEQKRKLTRYDNLHFDKLTDDWEIVYNNLQNAKNVLDLWQLTFEGKTPQEISTELEALRNKPAGTVLTPTQQEAINNYDKVKGALNTWTSIFGTKTPNEVFIKYNEPKGEALTKEQRDKLNNYDAIKKGKDSLQTRLDNAIKNLTAEQSKKKALSDEIDRLKEKVGNPLENIIVDKLKEVVISDEWNYPRLLETFKRFMDWRNSEDKEKRKIIYKYWKAINKNVKWLESVLNAS